MEINTITGIGYDSNIYLVKEGDSAHIIDTGTGEHSGYIMGKIQEKIDVQNIKSIILTHEHFDHTGGLVQLTELCPQAHVMMHKKCKDALEAKMEWTATAMGLNLPPVHRVLDEGDEITIGTTPLTILYTPGHSIGSICLYGKQDKTLVSGDTVFAHGGFGRTDLEGGSINDLISSLKRLQTLPITNIYPGHGPSISEKGQYHLALSLNAASSLY